MFLESVSFADELVFLEHNQKAIYVTILKRRCKESQKKEALDEASMRNDFFLVIWGLWLSFSVESESNLDE